MKLIRQWMGYVARSIRRYRENRIISDAELQRRLDNLNRHLKCVFENSMDDEETRRLLTHAELQYQRDISDTQTLGTPLSEDPTQHDIDRWCAALFREIIRRHRFPHRLDHMPTDVQNGILVLNNWVQGKPAPPSLRPDRAPGTKNG